MIAEEQQADLDRNLAIYADKHQIVAIARAVQMDGTCCVELRAAVWRYRKLQVHRHLIRMHEVDCLTTLAERFIDQVNNLFPVHSSPR
jgi:hypothetical protein